MKLAFVVYLSGKTDQTLQWHREQDTVAAWVTVEGPLAGKMEQWLSDTGIIEEPINLTGDNEVPLQIGPGVLFDAASDLVIEDESDTKDMANQLVMLCQEPTVMDAVHILKLTDGEVL